MHTHDMVYMYSVCTMLASYTQAFRKALSAWARGQYNVCTCSTHEKLTVSMHIVDVQHMYMYVSCYKWTIINTCIINTVQVTLCTVYMYTCSWDKKTVSEYTD